MKQTALHRKFLGLKVKMTDLQGWQTPLLFSDVQEECHAVRAAAGLFDVSYLGRIEVGGAGASVLLQKALTRDVDAIAEGTAHYSLICNETGHILDDPLIFHLPAEEAGRRYLLTTNAGNTEKVLGWLRKQAGADVLITDRTRETAQFALQGPQSLSLVEKIAASHFKKIRQGAVRRIATILEETLLLSRTGYTGEQGYELFMPAGRAGEFWDALLAAGSGKGLLPCGFSCRDTLRLEAGRLLYGNDIDETRTPLEAGLASFVDFKKDFIGKEALQNAVGAQEVLAGFVLLDKGIPKSGGSIFSENRVIGAVTSGVSSPHLRKGIGLGYVVKRYVQAGQEIEIEVRDREIAAKIVDLPFYRRK